MPIPPPAPPVTTPTAQGPAFSIPASLPTLPPPPSLPPQASIVPVREDHISALRRINSLLLPVTYPDAFYARILSPEVSGLFSRAILWQDEGEPEPKVVGGVVCRLEPSPFVDTSGNPQSISTRQQKPPVGPTTTATTSRYHAIYIQSLALLSPYRALGLAAAALENIAGTAALLRQMADTATTTTTPGQPPSPGQGPGLDVATIYAHVWTENHEGLQWYAARGFACEGPGPVHGYYLKLRPDTAWVMRREVGAAVPPRGAGAVSSELAARTQAPVPVSPSSTVAAAVNLLSSESKSAPAQVLVQAQTQAYTQAPTPVPTPPTATPSPAPSMSYQKARPDMEWNDLPADIISAAQPGRGTHHLSAPGSGASSSRSSSTGRKKKDRSYPAAAFGN